MSDMSDDSEFMLDSPKAARGHRLTTSSAPDAERLELLWEKSEESVITKWLDEAETRSVDHGIMGKRKKLFHKVFGSRSVVFPIVFAGLSQLKLQLEYPVISTVGFILTGVISALLAFFRFDGLTQKHFEYEAKYYEYALMIRSELCKPRTHRIACDVFLKEAQLKLCTLNHSAPDL